MLVRMANKSGYQTFRGNPEKKLFYILDNFIGGINTEFTDDSSSVADFEQIINMDMDKLGALHKRQGFGELTALSDILNLLGSGKLPTVKNRVEGDVSPEEDNDNIVYMKLLQNDNNCFRNLAGFSGKNGYREYQKMYGFQNNTFKILILTTTILNKEQTASYAWYYSCTLPTYDLILKPTTDTVYIKNIDYYKIFTSTDTIYKSNKTYFVLSEDNTYKALVEDKDYGAGETINKVVYEYIKLVEGVNYNIGDNTTADVCTIKDNIIINGYKVQLPVVFNWDRNLLNIENIEYYDKIYFTSNNKGLVCFDRNVDITSNETLGSAFSYSGFEDGVTNNAYKPTAFEITTYGYNLLGGADPINYVNDSSITSDSIQGCAIFNKDFKPTYNVIPASQEFKIGVYYTGQDKNFNFGFKSVENQTTYEASSVTVSPDTEHSRAGLKVYNVLFSASPTGEVEVKITMEGSSISPYYDYFTVGSVDNETLTSTAGINVGDCGLIFINDRAVYYKKDTIYFSQINDFTYVPSKNYITLPLESTDEITKICYFKKSYIIFTKYQIHKMTGTYSPTSTDFKREIVNESLGCHAGNTVVPIDNTLYFASPRGLYALKSNQFVEGYENVTELDLKVKTLTSDYTLYAENREKPAIRYNGINEHAYAVRYKDKYLLFYNNYDDKGDYAAQNGLDVLAYQYEIGAYTTYRFKEKPTFLFQVENALETLATVKEKEEFLDSEVVFDYDLTVNNVGNEIVDKSGNGNNANIVGPISINKSNGIELNGNNAYGEIADFDGNITDGFTLNVETKCERLNNEYLIDLQQENSSSLPTSGSITTNISNGYYARLDYTITPNSATKKDTISYRLYYLGNGTPSLVGDLTYTLDGSEGRLIGPITKPFDITTGSCLVDSGVFTINRDSVGSYVSTWSLNVTSKYVTISSGVNKGSDVSISDRYYNTSLSWIKVGFSNLVARATDTGCAITFTPAVRVTSGLRVGNRDLFTIINGVEYRNSVYIYTSNNPGVSINKGTEQTVYLNYTGSEVSMSVSFRFPVQFKQVSTGKWWSELTTATDTILLPSVEPYNYYINNPYSLYGGKPFNIAGYGGDSHRQIALKINGTNDQLEFIITSENGNFSMLSDVGIDLLARHSWRVTVIGDTCTLYRDAIAIKSQYINPAFVINTSRTKNTVGTDRSKSSYFKGTIYNLSAFAGNNMLFSYDFSDGSGNVAKDISQYNRNLILSNPVWEIVEGMSINGPDGYLVLPKFDSSVKFSNGFKIEFSGIINAGNEIIRIVDFAKSYMSENSPIKFNSINVGFRNNLMAFNSTGSNGRTYRVEASNIDTTIYHKYVVDCKDNNNGYDISIIIDDTTVAKTFFNYGGIADIVRNSNLICKSNNSKETATPKCNLDSVKLTIYGNVSGIAVYKSSIYEFDTTPKDFNQSIFIDVKTKAVNLEYPQHMKKLKNTFVKLIGGDNYSELYFEIYADGHLVNDPLKYNCRLDENGTIILEYYDKDKNLEVNGTLSLLGSIVLDKTKLDKSVYQTIKMVMPKKAKNFAIRIYGDSDEFLTLDSFGMVCKLGKVKQD